MTLVSKTSHGSSYFATVHGNKLVLTPVLFKMWNSPRFCFNSYLELDRGMRMRVRCAA